VNGNNISSYKGGIVKVTSEEPRKYKYPLPGGGGVDGSSVGTLTGKDGWMN